MVSQVEKSREVSYSKDRNVWDSIAGVERGKGSETTRKATA